LHQFLHQQNIERFRRKLADCMDDDQRATLRTLLAEEEMKAGLEETAARLAKVSGRSDIGSR
jgi:hypothetical protein